MINKTSNSTPTHYSIYRKIYYIRIIFAIIAGLLCGILNLKEGIGLIVGVSFFLLSYILFRYVIKGIYSRVKDYRKLYTTGIFSYFLIWYVIWVITYNIIWM
ncbi:MAG: Rab5-interacting family protein [Candidatus Verstraetearchaeota archaeon]|jgi:hypothetical protein|nr:Rab5-interacting family protein [Candidatus Verstraetearchaeota archaeon]